MSFYFEQFNENVNYKLFQKSFLRKKKQATKRKKFKV